MYYFRWLGFFKSGAERNILRNRLACHFIPHFIIKKVWRRPYFHCFVVTTVVNIKCFVATTVVNIKCFVVTTVVNIKCFVVTTVVNIQGLW